MPGARIVLSDLSQPMLDVACERIGKGIVSRACASRIRLVQADAQRLPFDDAGFDVVTCAYGIRNIPDRARALSEVYRVLKPGGQLLVCEFSTPPGRSWRALYHFYLDNVIPTVGGLLTGDAAEFRYLRDSIRAFPDQRAFCELLYAAGFADISYRNLSGGIVALHKGAKQQGSDG
jgi:demethylmenaquinone methyltransferase/2-methoxy-6-polyprenyl-1,4-benzoquinol methylase